jgi:flagellar assembly factor FliW
MKKGWVAKPLETLLPVESRQGLDLPNPYFFSSKFVRAHKNGSKITKSDNLVTLELDLNGNGGTKEIVLYESSEFLTIYDVAEKDDLKLQPATFQGELGERVMRATLDVIFNNIKDKYPGFAYNILNSSNLNADIEDFEYNEDYIYPFHRKIIGLSGHHLMAHGKFYNIFIYHMRNKTSRDGEQVILTNPYYLIGEDNPTKLIGSKFDKELHRRAFQTSKSELDSLIMWQHLGKEKRKGVIVCEAKTAGKSLISSKRLKEDYYKKILPVQEMFPDREVYYLLMGCPGSIVNHKNSRLTPEIRRLADSFMDKEVPFFALPYAFGAKNFADTGRYVYEQYKRFVKESDFNFRRVQGVYDEDKGLISLNMGDEKITLKKNGQGHYKPVVHSRV